MSEVIDLDGLAPKPVTIKFDNQEIEVKPPKTGDILRLGSLGQKMQNIELLAPEEVDDLIGKLTQQVHACIPELAGKHLETAQLMKLISILSEMAMPTDVEALKKQGITSDTASKVQ